MCIHVHMHICERMIMSMCPIRVNDAWSLQAIMSEGTVWWSDVTRVCVCDVTDVAGVRGCGAKQCASVAPKHIHIKGA